MWQDNMTLLLRNIFLQALSMNDSSLLQETASSDSSTVEQVSEFIAHFLAIS